MKNRVAIQVLLVILLGGPCCFARDVYVMVNNGQFGHGFLRQMQDECYVIVPKHVVALPGEITVIAPSGDRANAEVFKLDSSSDLALLRVVHIKKALCSGLEASVSRTAIRDALEDAQEALLHSVTADGSSIRAKVAIEEVTDQTLTVMGSEPIGLQKGMSGSVLSVKGIAVGMLIGIDKHGNGVAYRQEVIEDFWNRARPRINDCSTGCAFILSSSNFVKVYQPSEIQGDNSTTRFTQTRFDYVYRVPEGWPMPPYFHVWQDKIEVAIAGVAPSVTSAINKFSFSAEPTNRAADITINSPAFDTLGEASSIVNFGGKAWTVRVSQEQSRSELQVSIKPWVSAY